MVDFIDKKEKLADLFEEYLKDKNNVEKLLFYTKELKQDSDFKNKKLFMDIFDEIQKHIQRLSIKEIKQRILFIRSYID